MAMLENLSLVKMLLLGCLPWEALRLQVCNAHGGKLLLQGYQKENRLATN